MMYSFHSVINFIFSCIVLNVRNFYQENSVGKDGTERLTEGQRSAHNKRITAASAACRNPQINL